MSGRAAFGPNLRRARIHHGISLEAIADDTKVPVALWEGLEDNNLAGWPRGIYARAYIREYAQIIGVDPDDTVNEFCRLFPEGDVVRRACFMNTPRSSDTTWPGPTTCAEAPTGDRRYRRRHEKNRAPFRPASWRRSSTAASCWGWRRSRALPCRRRLQRESSWSRRSTTSSIS